MKRIVALFLILSCTLAFSSGCKAQKAEICKFKDNRKAAMSLVFVGETAQLAEILSRFLK